MQSVKHSDQNFKYVSRLFYDLERAYAITSERAPDLGSVLVPPIFDRSFSAIFDVFANYGYSYSVQYASKTLERLSNVVEDDKAMLVCVSGGKDSLAAAMHYKAKGYNVYLYHVTGVNKHYTTESKSARQLAELLGLPLITEDISYRGQHDWTEHPLKNMIFTAMAVNYAILHKLAPRIAVGNFMTAHLDNNSFEICAGDCVEMWKVFEHIVQRILPKFHVYMFLQTYQTSYKLIRRYESEHNTALMPLVQSCMTPNRFRGMFQNRTENKYKVKLLPNRCGCCWKCAVEYIWLVDNAQEVGYTPEPDFEYYYHCLELLMEDHKKSGGNGYNSFDAFWNDYFFYPWTKSVFAERLREDVVIYRKQISRAKVIAG